jgi:hypothetical protein
VIISDFIEKNLSEDQKKKGVDVADVLLSICKTTGLALIEPGYPVTFDYRIERKWCNGVALMQ